MLNAIWVVMVLGAVVCGALTGKLDAVAKATTDSAADAVTLAIGLVGTMAFWLGMMEVLHRGGLLRSIARWLRPVMTRLFPEVPADHPAMSMMILNMTSNMLGLGNAATPFGLKAMMALDELNPTKGTATDAMALFLAINTSNIALLPTGIIALRASLGSASAGSILVPTLLATSLSTGVAIVVAKLLARLPAFRRQALAIAAEAGGTASLAPMVAGASTAAATATDPEPVGADAEPPSDGIDTRAAESTIAASVQGTSRQRFWALAGLAVVVAAIGYAFVVRADTVTSNHAVGVLGALKTAVSDWPLVLLIVAILIFGAYKGVKIYDAVVEGGKEGFEVALRIIPYLVAILVAVGMLRASGAIALMVHTLQPITHLLGMPAEALPMALMRPLSGSGAYGIAAEIMKANGPDSLVGKIVSTMQGSSETTFYVLAVYFGVVQVKNARHTVAACLIADLAGALGAVWACRLLLG